jgi:signal transduction histidine kinase
MRWVQSTGRVLSYDEQGQPIRMVGIMQDIHARKVAELLLKRTNEELEQFAYIASHDLKAPLRGIDNLAKWIAEDLQDVITDDIREKFDLLRGRVARLEMLLQDILQYSRAGRIVDNIVQIDTKQMLIQIADSIALAPDFELRFMSEMPVIYSPYTPLEQVFQNLISNARNHHDKYKGVISVAAQQRGQLYEFTVTDDGPGIPAQFHDRIFKMFHTLKPRDEKEGSGLGLAIVKKLVEWQGGRVWVVNTENDGRGASFHFTWPIKTTIKGNVESES